MGVVLIESGDLNKQDKQIKFPGQAVSVAGETVSLEKISQTVSLLIRGNCST